MMSESHIRNMNDAWVSSFRQRYLARLRDDDSWMWCANDSYLSQTIGRAHLNPFALISDNATLGVLLLEHETQPSRLDHHGQLVYVHYIATAPWNRGNANGPGRFRGVGTSLMIRAILISRELGCEGRLGLHSLRSSDGFYNALGFHSLGSDAAHYGMSYFELFDPSDMDLRGVTDAVDIGDGVRGSHNCGGSLRFKPHP